MQAAPRTGTLARVDREHPDLKVTNCSGGLGRPPGPSLCLGIAADQVDIILDKMAFAAPEARATLGTAM